MKHHLDVVVALRDFLVRLRATGCVANEEELHFLAFTLREGAREAQRVETSKEEARS